MDTELQRSPLALRSSPSAHSLANGTVYEDDFVSSRSTSQSTSKRTANGIRWAGISQRVETQFTLDNDELTQFKTVMCIRSTIWGSLFINIRGVCVCSNGQSSVTLDEKRENNTFARSSASTPLSSPSSIHSISKRGDVCVHTLFIIIGICVKLFHVFFSPSSLRVRKEFGAHPGGRTEKHSLVSL